MCRNVAEVMTDNLQNTDDFERESMKSLMGH